jgi:excisionase family DNA binding protein
MRQRPAMVIRVLTKCSLGNNVVPEDSAMVNENEYMTTSEASESLGYTVQHTRLLVRQGRLRGAKMGRDWVVLRESVAEYVTQSNTTPLLPSMKRGRLPRKRRNSGGQS